MSEAKKIYESLKQTGDLKLMYSSMTGDWHKDSKKFIAQYNANEDLINGVMDTDEVE